MVLLKCFILGFSVSAPVGPIGLLCIQRVLSKGKTAGFLTGLGASTANILYAGIAAFSFTAVSAFLLEQEMYLRVLGTAFLFYIGINTYLKKPADQAAELGGESLLGMYVSTLLLMITNPITILNFAAMFAGLGFDQSSASVHTSFLLISGVFLGAITWWIILCLAVSIFRKKLTPHLGSINKGAGILIILLGFLSFIK